MLRRIFKWMTITRISASTWILIKKTKLRSDSESPISFFFNFKLQRRPKFYRTDYDRIWSTITNVSTFGQRDSKVSTLGPDTGAIRLYTPQVYLATWDTWIYLRWSLPRDGVHEFRGAQGGVNGHITFTGIHTRGIHRPYDSASWVFLRMTQIHLDYVTLRAVRKKKEKCYLFAYWSNRIEQ